MDEIAESGSVSNAPSSPRRGFRNGILFKSCSGLLVRPVVLAFCLVLGCVSAAPAGDSSPDAADPVFVALLLDGRTESGRIVSIAPAGVTLAKQDGKKELLSLERLVKLTRDTPGPNPAGESTQAVALAEGDRLMQVTIGAATETSLELRSELLGKLAVPLESILGLSMAGSGATSGVELLPDRLLFEPRHTEVVWLTNGDRIEGSFLGMDDQSIKMEVAGKPLAIDRSGAVALGFDPALVRYPRPKGGFVEATLSDGSRIGLVTAKLDSATIEATTRFGQSVRFPLSALLRLHARTDSVVYLTDRPVAATQYVPYVGQPRPFRVGRNVEGAPLQLGSEVYDRGLGTQSQTLIAYRIEPGDRRFQALVGIDHRAGPLASVVFRVLVDREERFNSKLMSELDAPRRVDIDLTGGHVLILETQFGDRGNVRDLADWVEARLVR